MAFNTTSKLLETARSGQAGRPLVLASSIMPLQAKAFMNILCICLFVACCTPAIALSTLVDGACSCQPFDVLLGPASAAVCGIRTVDMLMKERFAWVAIVSVTLSCN